MPYKYTTTFESEIFAHQIDDAFVSKASLNELSSLVPKNIDFEKNVDLLGVSFNAAVVNVFNRNGDGIDTSTALKYNDQFIHKPTNIEHNGTDIIPMVILVPNNLNRSLIRIIFLFLLKFIFFDGFVDR